MGLRIPQNQVVQNKYTAGKEYMLENNYREYIGYYYELNGNIFAGEEFNINALELIKFNSSKVNDLLTHPTTYTYGKLSKTKIPSTKIISQPVSNTNNLLDKGGEYFPQFYCSKINSNIIKSIDENTYVALQSNPLYKITFIGTYNNIYQTPDDAEKEIPGMNAFLGL